jgi:hypothetical protein
MEVNRPIMLVLLLALTVPVTTVALLYARWEYRKRGKLTVFGLASTRVAGLMKTQKFLGGNKNTF